MGEMLLTDQQAVIVLRLQEGVGLKNSKNQDILVTATLGGNTMETDQKRAGASTKFDINLVWETNKFSIKSMKTQNLPVKLECYAIDSQKKAAEREYIGSILIPVRSIPVCPITKALQIKPRWYRLIGLSSKWRQQRPELLLYIMITEKEFFDSRNSIPEVLSLKEPVRIPNTETVVIDTVPMISMLNSQQGIFIKLLQNEGLIQVGDIDTKCDIFVVKLLMKNIRNLESIEPENFHVKYDCLGTPLTCQLKKRLHGIHSMNETIFISFRSSLQQLQHYFEKVFVVPVEIFSNDDLIGSVDIRLQNHLKITNLEEFLVTFAANDHTAEFDGSIKMKTVAEGHQNSHTFLKYHFSIKYVSTKQLHSVEVQENAKESAKSLELVKTSSSIQFEKPCESNNERDLIDLGATGDSREIFELPPTRDSDKSPRVFEMRSVTHFPANKIDVLDKISKSEPNIATSSIDPITTNIATTTEPIVTELSTINKSEVQNNLPHIFSYNLIIQTISFQNTPKSGIYQFSFHHEYSQTLKTLISRDLKELSENDLKSITFDEPLELQLIFISNPDDIKSLIQSSGSCKLCVNGPNGMQTKALLDCKTLMARHKHSSFGLILLENQHREKVAMANVSFRLDDLGINYNVQQQWMHDSKVNEKTGKTLLLDEDMAYKMIEELEIWKSQQYEAFLVSLKEKESLYLSKLKHEWILKRSKLEQELVDKLEKYTNLTTALEEAQNCLKEKGSQYFQQEKLILKMKNDLEKSYNGQLLAMKERSRRLEEDLTKQVSEEELKYTEIETEKFKFEKENFELKEFNASLQREMMELKENLTPKDEVDNLLQNMKILNEKFEKAEQSKIFYKEEWAKLVREMHKIKMQNHYQTSDQILDSKLNRICYLTEDDVDF